MYVNAIPAAETGGGEMKAATWRPPFGTGAALHERRLL